MPYPKVVIDRNIIAHNLGALIQFYSQREIAITPVTKGVCGSVEISHVLSSHKIHSIGDSHIANIKKMRSAGVKSKFMLLRSPMRHEINETVQFADYSLHSEISTIRQLNSAASHLGRQHTIILMIEMGDRREGILPNDVDETIDQVLSLKQIQLAGIGCNLTCLNGIKPTQAKMQALHEIAKYIESSRGIPLEIISGGNSANYQWAQTADNKSGINHVRIGESILLGSDPIAQAGIGTLKDNAFTLQAEVIESKVKPSKPNGEITYDAFGSIPEVKDVGKVPRAILAIGQQDVDPRGCIPNDETLRVIGSTSDHMVIQTDHPLKVGDIVDFRLKYRALLPLMVSPYVYKEYI